MNKLRAIFVAGMIAIATGSSLALAGTNYGGYGGTGNFGGGGPVPTPTTVATPYAVNGAMRPATFWPYKGSVIWSSPVPAITNTATQYDPNSSTIITNWFPNATSNIYAVIGQEPGPNDPNHPIYYANAATDPTITGTCSTATGNACVTSGANAFLTSFLMPSNARSAESAYGAAGDSHLGVVQPNGNEADYYCFNGVSGSVCDQPPSGVNINWQAGNTIATPSGADMCGNYYTGPGQLPATSSGNTTAGGACEGAGDFSPAELQSGAVIQHALFLTTPCATGVVFPSQTSGGTNACAVTGPALGARLWYDVADATTNADGTLQPWEKNILNALHDYGGYVMDDVNGGAIAQGVKFLSESEEPAYRYGLGDQWSVMSSQGWNSGTITGAPAGYPRWGGGDQNANGGWQVLGARASHLHILAPCISQQTC